MTQEASSFDMDKGFYFFPILVVSNDDKSRKTIKKCRFWLEIAKIAFFSIWSENSNFRNNFNSFVQTYANYGKFLENYTNRSI